MDNYNSSLALCNTSVVYLHSYISYGKWFKNVTTILAKQVQMYDRMLPQGCGGF